jgi:hypothetical protein
MKTREEVEQLKRNWISDSWDDLETTEGFGEYFVELIKFRRKREKTRANQKIETHARLASYLCPMCFNNSIPSGITCIVEKCALWNTTMDLCSLAVDAEIKAIKHNREY